MKTWNLFFAIFIQWPNFCESLTYKVQLENGETFSPVDVDIQLNAITYISIGDGETSKGGETVVDFSSGYIATRVHGNKCYVFPIPSAITFNEFIESIRAPPFPDGKLRSLIAVKSYNFEDTAQQLSELICDFCNGRDLFGVHMVVEKDFVETRYDVETSYCEFSGYVYFENHGALTCFGVVYDPPNMFSFKVNGYDGLLGLGIKMETSLSTDSAGLIWILTKPEIMYEFGPQSSEWCSSYGYIGIIKKSKGLGAMLNLNTLETLVFDTDENTTLSETLKESELPNNNIPVEMACHFEISHADYPESSPFLGIECKIPDVTTLKNCQLVGNYTSAEQCKFLGFVKGPENRLRLACVRNTATKTSSLKTSPFKTIKNFLKFIG